MKPKMEPEYICNSIGTIAGIPSRIYFKEKLQYRTDLYNLIADPAELYLNRLFQIKTEVGYYITDIYQYYGVVSFNDYKFIIGPTSQILNTNQELKKLAFNLNIAEYAIPAFIQSIKCITRLPLESLLQILCVINCLFNETQLNISDITVLDSKQEDLYKVIKQQIKYEFIPPENDMVIQPDVSHNTYETENKLLKLVQSGSINELKNWCAQAPAINGGVMASSQLRQIKNTFIVTATLISRAAIRGGMNVNEAFQLSDLFIQRCELLESYDRIKNLQYNMIFEFTSQINTITPFQSSSELTRSVAQYVRHHLSENIKTEQIANALFLSRPYLSSKFKEETGTTLKDYILTEKIVEAKKLLIYSEKTISQISSYLGFSSQNHMTKVFHKNVGCTPSEYRKNALL